MVTSKNSYKVSERGLFQKLMYLKILYRDDSDKYQPTQTALDESIITKKKVPNGKAKKYVPHLTDCGKAYVITTIKLFISNNIK